MQIDTKQIIFIRLDQQTKQVIKYTLIKFFRRY